MQKTVAAVALLVAFSAGYGIFAVKREKVGGQAGHTKALPTTNAVSPEQPSAANASVSSKAEGESQLTTDLKPFLGAWAKGNEALDARNWAGVISNNTEAIKLGRRARTDEMLLLLKTHNKARTEGDPRFITLDMIDDYLGGSFFNRGFAHLELGNLRAAQMDFEEVTQQPLRRKAGLGNVEEVSAAWNNLGVICKANKNLQRAFQHFSRAIEINPRTNARWRTEPTCAVYSEWNGNTTKTF